MGSTKLFKRLGLALTGMALAIGVGVGLSQRGEYKEARATEVVYYQLTASKTGTNAPDNSYVSATVATFTGIEWNIYANTSMDSVWRFGGKNVTNTDRIMYNSTAIGAPISRIVINHNGLWAGKSTTATINSVTLQVFSDSALENSIGGPYVKNTSATLTAEGDADAGARSDSGSIEFTPEELNMDCWAINSYYKFSVNCTISNNNNSGLDVSSFVFYKTLVNCDSISLTGAPESAMEIGATSTLGYSATGTDGLPWTGDVTYSITNEKDTEENTTTGVVSLSATSGESVTLTALKPGTARVSVVDQAGNASADHVDITVLPNPERTDVPVGTYLVNIDYSGVKSGDVVPASKEYEIKDKVGSGAERIWYKNMSISYSNVTANYANEYTFSKDSKASTATITNNSDAKITRVVISYYNANRLTLTDASSQTIAIKSSETNVCTYDLDSSSFTLSSASTTTSIYYIKITFSVVDENEEFYSLVVSKGVSWDKTSYKDGQAPSSAGLVVTANYSSDGENISRSEDVTNQVSSWTFNPTTLTTSDTSFSVVATWDEHDSASFVVTGITVSAVAKKISIAPSNFNTGGYYSGTTTVGDYSIKSADVYQNGGKIQVKKSSGKLYNTEIGFPHGIKMIKVVGTGAITVTFDTTLKEVAGTVASKTVVEELGTDVRYYVPDTANKCIYFHIAKTSADTGYFTSIEVYSSESAATEFASMYLAAYTCVSSGASIPTATTGYTVANISTLFGRLDTTTQNILKDSVDAAIIDHDNTYADTIEEFGCRYYFIVRNHGAGYDFMSKIASISARVENASFTSDTNSNLIIVISVVSAVSLLTIGGYFFIRRRKER